MTLSDEDFEIVKEAIVLYNCMDDDSQIEESMQLLEDAFEVINRYGN